MRPADHIGWTFAGAAEFAALARLGYLCEGGVAVTIRGEPAAIGALRAPGPLPSKHLVLQEAASP